MKRKTTFAASAFAVILSFWAIHANTGGAYPNDAEVVEPGVQRTDVTRGSGWVGLYCPPEVARLSNLSSCKVAIGRRMGKDSDFPDGQDIDVEPSDNLVFAERGIGSLKAGRVTTNYYRPPDSDEWIVNRTFTLGKLKYRIRMTQDEGQSGSNRIILSYGGRSQVVDHMPNKFTTTPVWIGDLDGDGKPDLYVREDMNGGYSRRLLLLSTQARKGALVGEAAEYGRQLSLD